MQFRNLETTDIERLTACANECFADYEIPMQWTAETMKEKIHNEDIHLPLSVGAWDGSAMVGFILVGFDEVQETKLAWDGGTGVIPQYRGQKLTERMFTYLLPYLQKERVRRMLLEVLQNNTGACRIYERIGFKKTRLLHAYKGTLKKTSEHNFAIEQLGDYNPKQLPALADWQPAWQQMNKRILNRGDSVTTICIKKDNAIAAYMHYDDTTKRVHQFAVVKEYRRQGMARALFNHMAGDNSKPIAIINVDEAAENTNAFLKSIGIDYMISQYEMEMPI